MNFLSAWKSGNFCRADGHLQTWYSSFQHALAKGRADQPGVGQANPNQKDFPCKFLCPKFRGADSPSKFRVGVSENPSLHRQSKVPPHNGNDRRSLVVQNALPPAPLFEKIQNKGTQGVRAWYDAELPPFMSIVQNPGRPVILGMEFEHLRATHKFFGG